MEELRTDLAAPGGPDEFDQVAAALRADAGDVATFLDVLALKLGDSLPGGVSVQREGGLLRRNRRVVGIRVELGETRLALARTPSGIEAQAVRVVRGVALKTERVALDTWIGLLGAGLRARAAESAEARAALARLVT